jgi:hypothetical protein
MMYVPYLTQAKIVAMVRVSLLKMQTNSKSDQHR